MPTLMRALDTEMGVPVVEVPGGGRREVEFEAMLRARRASLKLAIGAGLLMLPALYVTVVGSFLVFPVLLCGLGIWFFARYCAGWRGNFGGPKLWWASVIYNGLGGCAWAWVLIGRLDGMNSLVEYAIPGLPALWCAFAAWQSGVVLRFCCGRKLESNP